ncbi:MAG: alpha-glucan family phosphorylase, partial [Bacteroidales bacterium]
MTDIGANTIPEILFEVSWEVCNKVGGIHTVLKTKCPEAQKKYGEHYILIGPDIWREEHENPEFIEDEKLFLGWKEQAYATGLRFRTGRWNIPGKPIVLIVDFTPLISHKNEIFSKAWEDYKLDSITGGWDYVESVLFGYASGLIIKSFIEYYRFDQVVAQYHEWMTGMGVLYLEKEAPYIGTVFTTHATTVGRSISGNGLPLYESLAEYNGDEMANRLNVRSKHSIEKLAALTANQFTTVSSITADECAQLLEKRPDVITPNGFDPGLVPDRAVLPAERQRSREQVRKVVEAVLGYSLQDDFTIIATSGRYEFRNKGLDLFFGALGRINHSDQLNKQVVALIMVPAHNYGPRKSISARIKGESAETSGSRYLTHNLHNAQEDIILKALVENGLMNTENDPVKAVFIPCYLNGNDGILNLTYYQVLAGIDYTVFPSYYEPWGYTPLESLAFGVPTLTTDLAGFGLWVASNRSKGVTACASVLPRRTLTDEQSIAWLEKNLADFIQMDEPSKMALSAKAFKLIEGATWEKLYQFYIEAYKASLSHVRDIDRPEQEAQEAQSPVILPTSKTNEPVWKRIFVESSFPDSLKGLDEISKNLWWSWNYEAENLFRQIDPDLWETVEQNPILLMRQIPLTRLQQLAVDKEFNALYRKVYADFRNYLDNKHLRPGPQIAYFSMEYGMHSSLKIYSGGLGILAGDYLKEASDQNASLIGFGLLYRYGYFRQVLTINGDQISEDHPELFASLPVEPVHDESGQWMQVQVALPGRMLHIRLWRVQVGRIPLYLLDTDFDANQAHDRSLTYHLYGGDEENRLKQEMVLGVGGIRMLNKLGINPDVFHCNEGHSAFIGLERIRLLMEVKRFTFEESREVVRASTLFTTHTPVPAGHDTFTEDLIRTYMGHYPERLNITWSEFINLGRVLPDNPSERFSMSHLACRLSMEINAVSRLHGEVTRRMFSPLWNGYYPEELHIGYVTNGVHYQTWTAEIWQKLHIEYFGQEFLGSQSDTGYWEKILQVPDERIWNIRNGLRSELISYLKSRLKKGSIRRHEPPKQILEIM